jgi:homoserine O-acetyltransferase/O-succinyltransferase
LSAHFERFELGPMLLQCGQILPDAALVYKTYGQLSDRKDNVVLLPTFFTGTHVRNEGFFGPGRAIDPARHFVISINMFGNGLSSSPSNTLYPFDGPRFPEVTLHDNVRAQYKLLSERFGITSVALVTGWSMAGCQAYQWAAQYPDAVKAILPFCASAKTSPHNFVFLEGVKAALQADCQWSGGEYHRQPTRGLKAFARVYAGWAYSQTFYREGLYRKLGFNTIEDLLRDWEEDHLKWDANDLLAKLRTWQQSDISANDLFNGDFVKALRRISARTILIPCSDDLYFPPADNEIEIQYIKSGKLCVFESRWGHCVASPGNEPKFERFLDTCLAKLLND